MTGHISNRDLDKHGQHLADLEARRAPQQPRIQRERQRVGGYAVDADLRLAQLVDCDLRWLRAKGANLAGANLAGSNLSGMDLTGANLTGANLRGCLLIDTILDDVDLTSAVLDGAVLLVRARGATLDDASLCRTRIRSSDLTGARLDGADLTGAHIVSSELSGARLERTILTDAELAFCGFKDAVLQPADVEGARFLGEDTALVDGHWTIQPLPIDDDERARLVAGGATLDPADLAAFGHIETIFHRPSPTPSRKPRIELYYALDQFPGPPAAAGRFRRQLPIVAQLVTDLPEELLEDEELRLRSERVGQAREALEHWHTAHPGFHHPTMESALLVEELRGLVRRLDALPDPPGALAGDPSPVGPVREQAAQLATEVEDAHYTAGHEFSALSKPWNSPAGLTTSHLHAIGQQRRLANTLDAYLVTREGDPTSPELAVLPEAFTDPKVAAELSGVDLRGSFMTERQFAPFSRFDGSRCTIADFSGSTLHSATFHSTDLRGATLDGVDATRASFRGALAKLASFNSATLDGVRFDGADLRRASFVEASLRDVDFRTAQLDGADLTGADLTGATFTSAQRAQLESAGVLEPATGPHVRPGASTAAARRQRRAARRRAPGAVQPVDGRSERPGAKLPDSAAGTPSANEALAAPNGSRARRRTPPRGRQATEGTDLPRGTKGDAAQRRQPPPFGH